MGTIAGGRAGTKRTRRPIDVDELALALDPGLRALAEVTLALDVELSTPEQARAVRTVERADARAARGRVAQLEAEAAKRTARAAWLTYSDAAREFGLGAREKTQLRALLRRRRSMGRAAPMRRWHEAEYEYPRSLVEELMTRVKSRTRALRRK